MQTKENSTPETKYVQAHLAVAKSHVEKDLRFWLSVLWSAETKMGPFGHRDVAFAW